jgi:hypothetical protein
MRNRRLRVIRRSWFHLVLVLAMLPLLACNCAMLEGLLQGISPPTVETTAVAPPPAGPLPTLVLQPRPTFPSIALDELDVPLIVTNPSALPRQAEPVTSGLPLPRQLGLTDVTKLRLLDPDGTPVPAQFTPLARWGGAPDDGSAAIRWLLLDFQANVPAGGTTTYRLRGTGGPAPPLPTLNVTDGADAVTIDTGVAVFSVSKRDGGLTAPGLSAPMFGRIRESGGGEYTAGGPVEVSVELSGPLRASVKVKGSHGGGLDYTSRFWFYAGQPGVRLFHTVENNTLCPVAEDGQLLCYHIGSGGDVTFTELSLIVPTALGGGLTYQVGGAGAPASGALDDTLVLYQDSSGTDHWDKYPTMTDWEGRPLDTRPRMQSYVNFRGYRITLGGATVESGDQAAGWLSISGADGAWTVGARDFWQNFPKALRAAPDGNLEIGLFPEEFGPADYSFTLRAGEHKTHEILLLPLPSETGFRGETFSNPLFAQAPPEWYVGTGAFGPTALRDFEAWPDHELYLDQQLAYAGDHVEKGDYFSSLLDSIEGSDFYGIFDYGDWPLDYEGYEVAPLNPKYNNDYGVWLQWLRGGDQRWFGLAEAFDRHAADVDILHTLHSPRSWADGTAFGHSEHDEDGFTNPHRNANSSHPDTIYGMAGMLLTYYLTGYEKAYESALELADSIEYRVHNDWLLSAYFPDSNGEGWGMGDGIYGDGSRPNANNLFMLTEAYRATADPRYLAAADAIADWARPADQPYINGPTGESEWNSYLKPQFVNLYCQALGRYLEMREEFGLPDTYDAVGSLVGYADWLRTYAWIDLEPIDTGERGAYPYEWYFDDRQGDPSDDYSLGNNVPVITNWLLLGADVMAYAYRYSGNPDYMESAARLFRTGSRDPWFEGDDNIYYESKETANSVAFGHVFLYEWANRP